MTLGEAPFPGEGSHTRGSRTTTAAQEGAVIGLTMAVPPADMGAFPAGDILRCGNS